MPEATRPREMTLPATTLITLRRALRGEADALTAVHALQAAGSETGEAVAPAFLSFLGADPEEVTTGEFWSRFREFWSSRGWGGFLHRTPHPAIGLLVSSDWVEAGDEARESQPSCAFTSGLLATLLSRVAAGPVAVLEIRCRSRGDEECAFAFGSETAIHELYGTLLEGAEFDDALASL